MSHLSKKLMAFLFFTAIVGMSVLLIIRREEARGFESSLMRHEALFYKSLHLNRLQCLLCPTRCVLSSGQWGACKARRNIGGKLYSAVYGTVSTVHVDPIEKKPFFHVLPGTEAFSLATTGCNMHCLFCQNWEISQIYPGEIQVQQASPEQIVSEAVQSGARSIAFTYNEPVIAYEYVLDIAKLAQSRGLKTLMVSSGYIEEEPLRELLKHIDAYKVDLKAFNEKFYQKLTGGDLNSVLKTMKTIRDSGVWLEIVNLLIPGENDSDEDIRAMAQWIRDNLGNDVPLHFSRFFPQYKLQNLPPTPVETIIRARQIAMEEGLQYVYTGNIPYPDGEATHCPKSGEKVIARVGHSVLFNKLKQGECPDGEKIPGIWD